MSRKRILVNFDDPQKRRALADKARIIRGWHWVEIEPHKDQRTLRQNAYYFGLVLSIVADAMFEGTGEEWDIEDCHLFCKMSFLPARKLGNVKLPTSTTSLNTVEFTEYLDKIKHWLGEELGMEVPEPSHDFKADVN